MDQGASRSKGRPNRLKNMCGRPAMALFGPSRSHLLRVGFLLLQELMSESIWAYGRRLLRDIFVLCLEFPNSSLLSLDSEVA